MISMPPNGHIIEEELHIITLANKIEAREKANFHRRVNELLTTKNKKEEK